MFAAARPKGFIAERTQPSEIEAALGKINPDELTPKAALDALYALKGLADARRKGERPWLTSQIDGRIIEYRVIPGDAAKPWLVFLHEGLGCVALWRDFPDKIARRLGCRALIYSRFGYGASAPLDGPRAPNFMHDEALDVLPKLLAALHIDTPVLIGHSDGASIALIHAAHHPVRALVVMAPHVMVEPISTESITRIRQTYRTSDLRARLARHHRHVDDAFLGWADVWLLPEFRAWRLDAEVARITAPRADDPGHGRRLRHAGATRRHRGQREGANAARGAAELRPQSPS